MNEDDLRALVRAAIQRHLSLAPGGTEESIRLKADATGAATGMSMSFAQYSLERTDTMCIIEPSVRCNHCGFCKCHGH